MNRKYCTSKKPKTIIPFDCLGLNCLQRKEHLSIVGVFISDEYYYWSGCNKAIDDYFLDKKKPLLCKTEHGCMAVKI